MNSELEVGPEPPDPLTYGLTPERVGRLADPGLQDWLVSGPFMWVSIAAALGAFLIYGTAKDTLIGLFVGAVGPFVFFGVVEEVWPRLQPDYRAFRKYKAAELGYQAKRAAWEREREEWWAALSARSFERELAALLRQRGHRVDWTGRAGDGGVDLRIEHPDGTQTLVQCKAHAKPIGPAAVRDLYGAMVHARAAEAWVVSTKGFTQAAREFGEGKRIRLRTIAEILRDRSTPPNNGLQPTADERVDRRG